MAGDDLLVGVGVDLGGLARDVTRATAYFQRFQKDVDRIVTRAQFGGDFSERGRKAAAQLLGGLEAEFRASSADLRELLARGHVSDEQFRVLGIGSAESFNKALAEGIDRLDAEGLLPQGLRQELQNQFKDVGETSGEAMAQAIADKLDSIGDRITGIGKGLSAGLTAPLIALATGAVAASETIDEALDIIRIGTGKTGAQLRGLEGDFDAVFSGVPVTATDAATAITLLSQRTGETGANLRTLATDVLNLSRITKTDLTQNVERSQRLFQSFGVAVADQGAALNFLFRATQATGTRFDDLATSMTRFGPSLRQLGFDFEESAALLAQFEREGVDVDQTLGRMQQALVKFAAKGVEAPRALESLISQIKRAESETKAVNIAANIFGSRGAAGFVAAVREGRIAFDDLLETIRRSPDTIAAAARDTDGFQEALQQLRNEATRALAPLGVELVSALREMLPQLVSTARTVGSLAKSFAELSPATQKFLIGTDAFGASIGPLLIGVGSMVSGFGRLVPLLIRAGTAATAAAGAGTTTGLAALGARLAVGGPVIAGLGALAAAMLWASKKTEDATVDLLALRNALDQVSDNRLLSRSLTELGAQYDVVLARIQAIKDAGEVNVTVRRGTGPGGVSTEVVRNPALVEQERQLKLISTAIDEINRRWRANQQAATDATETARQSAEDMKRILGEFSGPDIDFGTTKAEAQLTKLESNVRQLLSTYDDLQSEGRQMPGIVDALVKAHDRVGVALKAQTDQYSTHAIKLRALQRQLEAVDAIIVASARREFGGIENIPTVPRLEMTADVTDIRLSEFKKKEFVIALGGLVHSIVIPPSVKDGAAKDLFNVIKLPPIPLTIDPTFDPKTLSVSLQNAFDDLKLAKADIALGTLIDDRGLVTRGSEAARAATEKLKAEVESLAKVIRNASDLTPAQKAFGLEALQGILDEAADGATRLRNRFDDIAGAAFGISTVAREIRGVDAEVIDAIDSVGRLANALGDLSELKLTGDGGIFSSFNSFLESIPVVGEAIGSLINTWNSIGNVVSGRGDAQANQQIMRDNTEALTRLAQDLAGFGDTIGELTGDAGAIQQSAILRARRGDGFERGFKNIEALDAELRAAGSSIADLKRRAEEFGITIVDAKGRISAQGLDALNTALMLAAHEAANFANTLTDLRFIQSARRDILDIDDDPTAAFNDAFEQIQKFAPALFDRFLTGIDISTEAGRQAAEDAIRALFEFLTKPGTIIPPELFGGFGSVEDFIDSLLDADNALDGMAEAAEAVASASVNVVEGFRDFNLARAKFQATTPVVRPLVTPPITPSGTVPVSVPAAQTSQATPQQTVIQVDTVIINGSEYGPSEWYDGVKTEATRRARASGNPQVKTTVTLLP